MKVIFASFIFFTRLPLWKLVDPPRDAYRHVVEWWPLVGWLTALVMGGTMWLASLVLPWTVAIILGFAARLLLTGALHEDGLADFCDGFGGGTTRERTLEIMKDSHIGTYGVLGLIIYYLLLFSIFLSRTPLEAFFLILAGDPYAKMLGSQIVQMLPYARTEEQAKSKTVYSAIGVRAGILLFVQALIPVLVSYFMLTHFGFTNYDYHWLIFLPCLVMYVMYMMMRNRLHGYTGDCCGAIFLAIELSFYLACLL